MKKELLSLIDHHQTLTSGDPNNSDQEDIEDYYALLGTELRDQLTDLNNLQQTLRSLRQEATSLSSGSTCTTSAD